MARENKNREQNQSIEPRNRTGQVSRFEPWSGFGPFGMMRRWVDDFDRMLGDFGFPTLERFGSTTGTGTEMAFSPHVDMFERDGKLVISADLPALNKDDIKVDVTDDAVVIEGERKCEHEESKGGVYHCERSYGQFRRQIPLPEGVKTDTAAANFKNGVLEITMDAPKMAQNRRRIQIQGEKTEKAA